MSRERHELNRRTFIKTGIGTATSVAAFGTGTWVVQAAPPTQEETPRINGMPTRRLPRSGQVVPIFGLGTATLQYSPLKRERKVKLVRYAYEKGVRYFDTANNYETEDILGEALKDVRDAVYLNTKTMAGNAKTAREHVEGALKKLQTEAIDCVKVHLPYGYDRAMRILDELEKMRDEGKIINVGMSNHIFFEVACKLVDTGRLDEVLLARCYFPKGETSIISHRNAEFREMALARARQLGMNIIGMKALGAFMFTAMHKMWVPDYDEDKAGRLPGAAIRWAYSDHRFHVYIIGCDAPEQIDANVALCSGDMTFTNEDRLLLTEFVTKVWESENIKKCPVVFANADAANDVRRVWEGRRRVMAEVMKHGKRLWQESLKNVET